MDLSFINKMLGPAMWSGGDKRDGATAPASPPPAPTTAKPPTPAPAENADAGGLPFGGLFDDDAGAAPEKKGGIGGLLGSASSKLFEGSEWARESLPGALAAPVGGTLGALGGLGQAGQGFIGGDTDAGKAGLKTAGLEALSTIGLKEVVGESWGRKGEDQLPTGLNMPPTLAGDIADVRQNLPDDSHKNGMHSWHAGTNAALANRLGPMAALPLWLGGLVHESPIDLPSFKAEEQFQGTVNHALDSSMDIVANTLGIGLGLALPRDMATKAAIKLGNLVPGPGDPDPEFGGNGAYKGDPTKAWGQYPK